MSAKWYSGKPLAQITAVALTVVAVYSAIDQLFLRDIKQHESRLVQLKAEIAQAALDSLNIEKKRITATIDSVRVRAALSALFGKLMYAEVLKRYRMIKANNYYDRRLNPEGAGTDNQFELQVIGEDSVVYDATTGLTWQQSGSDKSMNFERAQDYVRSVNEQEFAGYSDWRLPTFEEAMSLMEPEQSFYIDPIFYQAQSLIWTADKGRASSAWVVGFLIGRCFITDVDINFIYVRAVR